MRFTTDRPDSNFDMAMNLFYGKDSMVMVRGCGQDPDPPDVPLETFMRRIIRAYKAEIPIDCSDEDLDDMLFDCLFEGPDEIEGLIAMLYTTGWVCAELRSLLKKYEDDKESGYLVKLPCKPGDTVYRITGPHGRKRVVPREVILVTFAGENDWCITSTASDMLGKTVFLTEQEAKDALAKTGKEDCE